MPEGTTGFGLGAGTHLWNGPSGELIATLHPAVDLFVTGARRSIGGVYTETSVGGGATAYVRPGDASKVGLSLRFQRSFGDDLRSLTTGVASVDVTHQVSVSDIVRLAPHIAVDVAYNHNDGGSTFYWTVLTGTAPVMLDLPRARPYIAPSVSIGQSLAGESSAGIGFGLKVGIVLFSSR